jgi:hypothetical protein
MTTISLTPPEATIPLAETFWQITVRRIRYLILIVLWWGVLTGPLAVLLQAPPGHSGLLLWQPGRPWWASLGLVLYGLVTAMVSTALLRDDHPHRGIFCALLALGVAAWSKGNMQASLLLLSEPDNFVLKGPIDGVWLDALVCLFMLLVMFWVCARVYAGMAQPNAWILRLMPWLPRLRGLAGARPVTTLELGWAFRAVGTRSKRWQPEVLDALLVRMARGRVRRGALDIMGWLGAWAISAALGLVLAYVLLRSGHKGQAALGTFFAFLFATYFAQRLRPGCPLVIMATVPVILGSVAWYMTGTSAKYPGVVTWPLANALPVDYLTFGVAGAIWGYYTAVHGWAGHVLEKGVGEDTPSEPTN